MNEVKVYPSENAGIWLKKQSYIGELATTHTSFFHGLIPSCTMHKYIKRGLIRLSLSYVNVVQVQQACSSSQLGNKFQHYIKKTRFYTSTLSKVPAA